jgi:glycosyltransferase involved in cell wall biosynthesis
MVKKKKIFFIKNIFICLNIIIYFFEIKSRYKIINIQNFKLIKSFYNKININLFINYVNDCKFLKRINNNKFIKNEHPFLSIIISTFNSEKYVEKAILSVINQSFQDFEIIVINDNSIDKTYQILMKLQKEDQRIKIINHSKNLGTYHSRAEGALNSKSEYILFLDPDDMIFNPFLFEKIYKCYLNYNLDIIEYTVFYLRENEGKVYYSTNPMTSHYHNYFKKIIYQPELSNIIYYKPNSKIYSSITCRTLWNKIFKRNLVLKSIKYIGNSYYNKYYIVVVEDTLFNIILFNFANNYTNLKMPGYLYNKRKSSISRSNNKDLLRKKSISFFLFYQLFYRLIKEFDKDRNYLYYELRPFGRYLLNLGKYNNTKYFLNKTKIMINKLFIISP